MLCLPLVNWTFGRGRSADYYNGRPLAEHSTLRRVGCPTCGRPTTPSSRWLGSGSGFCHVWVIPSAELASARRGVAASFQCDDFGIGILQTLMRPISGPVTGSRRPCSRSGAVGTFRLPPTPGAREVHRRVRHDAGGGLVACSHNPNPGEMREPQWRSGGWEPCGPTTALDVSAMRVAATALRRGRHPNKSSPWGSWRRRGTRGSRDTPSGPRRAGRVLELRCFAS